MFERPATGQGAVIVHLAFGDCEYAEAGREFRELVDSAEASVLAHVGGSRRAPDPKFFVGGGKVDEIAAAVATADAALVVFNHDLSPSQERNLEKRLGARVLDRAGLILDIFARRARSHEGKLQVELAQLRHLSTRLVRGWSHLERQRGGIGLRGPGETQLETDRRLLGDRIALLGKRLDKVIAQRDQNAAARREVANPIVAVVGYTNAGKSTLFNRLTVEHNYTADQLFATLDPTLRRMPVPTGRPLIVSDTVGFIRDLPHELVAAFRATLEQTRDASVLVHVIDAANPAWREQRRQVNKVLAAIDADDIPQIEVFNKIDRLTTSTPGIEYDGNARPARAHVSAATGDGVEALRAALAEFCYVDLIVSQLCIPASAGDLRASMYRIGDVQAEDITDDGDLTLTVAAPQRDVEQAIAQAGFCVADVQSQQRPRQRGAGLAAAAGPRLA